MPGLKPSWTGDEYPVRRIQRNRDSYYGYRGNYDSPNNGCCPAKDTVSRFIHIALFCQTIRAGSRAFTNNSHAERTLFFTGADGSWNRRSTLRTCFCRIGNFVVTVFAFNQGHFPAPSVRVQVIQGKKEVRESRFRHLPTGNCRCRLSSVLSHRHWRIS